MGMSDKKTTSTNNTVTSGTTASTTTPTNPAWVDQGLAGLGSNIDKLAGSDPYSYVAGPNALQTQAGAAAGAMTGTPWTYDASNSIAGGVANEANPSIAGHLKEFMNPYTNDVVNTTLAGYDKNAGYSRAGDTLARAGDSTFGGSGGAIQTALNEQNIAQGRAQTEAQLRDQGFQTALGGATSQAGLDAQTQAQRLAAASQLTTNANDFGANQRANIDTQAGIGGTLQSLDQAKAASPLTLATIASGLYGALPLNLLHGSNTNGTVSGTSNSTGTETTSDPLGQISKLLQAIGSLGGGGGGGGRSAAAAGG